MKIKKILVDADALVALAKNDDSNHQKALTISKELINDKLFITPFTVPEAVTVLSYKVNQTIAKRFLNEVRKRKLIELDYNAQVENMADEIFLSQDKKGSSWIDCLNVAMVKINELDGVFSFDRFYEKQGLRVF